MLAMGSYSSLPPVLAARRCSIKVVLHEANTVPGRAVEFLSRFAEKVAVSFESTKNYLPSAQCVRTGLPVRPAITQGRRFEGIPENSFVVFVTGGSQGAHAVNELVQHAFELLKTELESREGEKRPLYVIHQTGFADEGLVRMTYTKANIHSRVRAFEDRMSDAYASADFVIARAGASTCFELALVGKPALLVPLPTSMRNHQHFNAEAFASVRAADEGIQGNLTARQLSRYLLHVYDNPGKCSEMAERMKHLATPDAAQNLVRLLEEIYAAK